MVPAGLGSLVALLIVGRLADRHGSRIVVLAGLVLASLATIPFMFATSDARARRCFRSCSCGASG